MSTTYISAVPLTMVRTVEGSYRNVLEGDPIEGDAVDPDDLKRLLRKKFLVEKPADDDTDGGSSKPTPIKDILSDVGNDKAKAQAALDEEQARGDDARPTLVEKLQAVIAAE